MNKKIISMCCAIFSLSSYPDLLGSSNWILDKKKPKNVNSNTIIDGNFGTVTTPGGSHKKMATAQFRNIKDQENKKENTKERLRRELAKRKAQKNQQNNNN